MRLADANMVTLLPNWMRRNADVEALAGAADRAAREVYQGSRLLTIWDKIDMLPEGVLDELAWELDIEWYDSGAPIETKRELIRQSDYVHSKKGTIAAVESVVNAYFGDGRLMEWFEYGGAPHHFKVFLSSPELVDENLTRFLSMLAKIKRHSSKLDSIMIGLTGEQYIYIEDGYHIHDRDRFLVGDGKIKMRTAAAGFDNSAERHYMGTERRPEADMFLYRTRALVAHKIEHMRVEMRTDKMIAGDLVGYRVIGYLNHQLEHVAVRMGTTINQYS